MNVANNAKFVSVRGFQQLFLNIGMKLILLTTICTA